jgi:hypothetical protein
MKREIEIERFKAVDEDGNQHTIICYQATIESNLMNGSVGVTKGLKKYVTSTYEPVDAIDSETFKIITTDQIVRKIS